MELFVLGRAAKQAGEVRLASSLFRQAQSTSDPVLAARATAHLAHVAYFEGDFRAGLALTSATAAPDPLARAEIALYRSVNLVALNDAEGAARSAEIALRLVRRVPSKVLRADLRFRCARQLVHVLIARGEYLHAVAEAEAAAAAARYFGDRRRQGYASYLRGSVEACRGHANAAAHFSRAEAHWAEGYPGLHGWLRLVWAQLLRDLGDIAAAELVKPGDRELPPWERALFALARGERPDLPDPASAPLDHRPFLRATRGLLHLAAGRPADAVKDLSEAAFVFERGSLNHYRRGAAMGLAFAHAAEGRTGLAVELVIRERNVIVSADLHRWPWWDTRLVRSRAQLLEAAGLGRELVRQLVTTQREPVTDDALLEAHGLTPRESEIVRAWLRHPHFTRAELAAALGVRESSVRSHLNAVRHKLEPAARGPAGLHRAMSALRSARHQALM